MVAAEVTVAVAAEVIDESEAGSHRKSCIRHGRAAPGHLRHTLCSGAGSGNRSAAIAYPATYLLPNRKSFKLLIPRAALR
jgi:hypothetical protein